jgi:MFS family permease
MGALVGGGIAAFLSLCILSRAIANNPLYRFAQSLLVGTSLGYISAVLIRSAIVPRVTSALTGTAGVAQLVIGAAGILLGLLLLPRFGRQRGSYWANVPLAILFGVGAAVALAGAMRGTLLPQLFDTVRLRGLTGNLASQIGTVVLAILTVLTLLTFTYTLPARQAQSGEEHGLRRGLRGLGRVLILLTFGVFFAATVTTYIYALVGQVDAIRDWLTLLFGT